MSMSASLFALAFCGALLAYRVPAFWRAFVHKKRMVANNRFLAAESSVRPRSVEPAEVQHFRPGIDGDQRQQRSDSARRALIRSQGYVAVLRQIPKGYSASFVDLPDCFAEGNTDYEAAVSAARSLGLRLEQLLSEGHMLPPPTPLGEVETAPEHADAQRIVEIFPI